MLYIHAIPVAPPVNTNIYTIREAYTHVYVHVLDLRYRFLIGHL